MVLSKSVRSGFATGCLSILLGGSGYVASELLLNSRSADAAPYIDSANVEWETTGASFFNTNNCSNSAIYTTANGSRFITGTKASIDRCKKSVKRIGAARHISYYKFIGGSTALNEVVYDGWISLAIPRSRLMFAPVPDAIEVGGRGLSTRKWPNGYCPLEICE